MENILEFLEEEELERNYTAEAMPPAGEKPLAITFKDFVVQLSKCLVEMPFDDDELHGLFHDYKSSQYIIVPKYRETVSEWAQDWFKNWNLETHQTCLNSNK